MNDVNLEQMQKFMDALKKEPIIQKVGLKVHLETDVPRSTLERALVKLAEERCPGTECVTRSIPLSTELE